MIITDTTPCLEVIIDEETDRVARLIIDQEGKLLGEPGKVWIVYHRDRPDQYSVHRTRKSVNAFLRGLRRLRLERK